jgi:hypothetical protein
MSLIKTHYWDEITPNEDGPTPEEWEQLHSYYLRMKKKMEQTNPTWEQEMLDFFSPLMEEEK